MVFVLMVLTVVEGGGGARGHRPSWGGVARISDYNIQVLENRSL